MNYKAISFLLLLGAGIVSCNEETENAQPLIKLSAQQTSVSVGSKTPVKLDVAVTKEASGDSCVFETTAGSFSATADVKRAGAVVDITGHAKVFYFAPDAPGKAFLKASIQTVVSELSIDVAPVSGITITAPDSVKAGTKSVIGLEVSAPWAAQVMQVSCPQAIVKVLGPADKDIDTGTKVYPVMDSNGKAQILLTAPASPDDVIITVSMFGTVSNKVVKVY